jgi:hypothetical protein
MDSASTTESNNQLKSRSQHEPADVEELHSFPKLPVELQREIWRLAVPPRVIRLQLKNYGESNLVGYRRRGRIWQCHIGVANAVLFRL